MNRTFPFVLVCFHQPASVSDVSEKQNWKMLSMLNIIGKSGIMENLLRRIVEGEGPSNTAFYPCTLNGAVVLVIVGKKWEPGNLVPSSVRAKLGKLRQD